MTTEFIGICNRKSNATKTGAENDINVNSIERDKHGAALAQGYDGGNKKTLQRKRKLKTAVRYINADSNTI